MTDEYHHTKLERLTALQGFIRRFKAHFDPDELPMPFSMLAQQLDVAPLADAADEICDFARELTVQQAENRQKIATLEQKLAGVIDRLDDLKEV